MTSTILDIKCGCGFLFVRKKKEAVVAQILFIVSLGARSLSAVQNQEDPLVGGCFCVLIIIIVISIRTMAIVSYREREVFL